MCLRFFSISGFGARNVRCMFSVYKYIHCPKTVVFTLFMQINLCSIAILDTGIFSAMVCY